MRELLGDRRAERSTVITALRTLDQLGVLAPADVEPFIRHEDAAVRIHALQLADRWFGKDQGRALPGGPTQGARHYRGRVLLGARERDPDRIEDSFLRDHDRLARQRLERHLGDPIRERAKKHVLSFFQTDEL